MSRTSACSLAATSAVGWASGHFLGEAGAAESPPAGRGATWACTRASRPVRRPAPSKPLHSQTTRAPQRCAAAQHAAQCGHGVATTTSPPGHRIRTPSAAQGPAPWGRPTPAGSAHSACRLHLHCMLGAAPTAHSVTVRVARGADRHIVPTHPAPRTMIFIATRAYCISARKRPKITAAGRPDAAAACFPLLLVTWPGS